VIGLQILITYHLSLISYHKQNMANIPENLRYSKDHEWVSVEGDTATIGITDYAQHSLGDVVYVELPKAGETFGAHEAFGSVESVKAVSEIFMPVSGEVLEVNEGLNDTPEVVNGDPYGGGWMVRLKMNNAGEADALLNAVEYEEFLNANA
jgi:glycine cleavage system H protein